MHFYKFTTRQHSGSASISGNTAARLLRGSRGVRYIRKILPAITVLLAFHLGHASAAPILTVDDASGILGLVNVATGQVTVIGNMGVVLTDVAYDPNGNLFGISFDSLYRVNPQTAAVTLIGSTGIPAGNALVFGTDGTLYAAGAQSTSLFTVNRATGAATSIGNIGVGSAGDLAFDNGSFFFSAATGDLIKINLANVADSTIVGPFGVPNVFGLATGSDGILYATAGTFIYSVNTSTGAATRLVNYFGDGLGVANGAAFFTEAGATGGPTSVPEPSTFFLLWLGAAGTASLCSYRHWRTRHGRPRRVRFESDSELTFKKCARWAGINRRIVRSKL